MSGYERTETLRALIPCDGAAPPKMWDDEDRQIVPVTSTGSRRDLNLHVTELGSIILDTFDARANDLVRIAAYVFAADQLLSRGGDHDPHRRRWKRDMAMVVPVLVPEFWSQPEVVDSLCQALAFGTDDLWSFSFTEGRGRDHQLRFEFEEAIDHRGIQPDSVVLFSGGMDSLCAMVEAVTSGLSPIAVSHRASPSTMSPQRQLTESLRRQFPAWLFPHLSFRVHQRGEEAKERTRRTRGFLFAALGAAVAGQLGIPRVLLSDNGYVSVNPPINAQLVGALNSRGTHPTFLRLVNRLLELVFPDGVLIENSLMSRTRAEALQILKDHGCSELVRETRSCANSRMSEARPHCGVCSQCVDRRFATIRAGLETVDPADRYLVDIFRDSLPDGTAKTFAVSYVEFARRTVHATPDDLVLELPELEQCFDLDAPDPSASANRVHGVLTRHSREVVDVLANEFERASQSLALGAVQQDSLLILAMGAPRASAPIGTLSSLHKPNSAATDLSSAPGINVDPDPLVPNTFGGPLEDGRLLQRVEPQRRHTCEIERLSGGWWVRFESEKALLKNTKGVRQLVILLKAPGTDVPALDLYAEVASTKTGNPDPDVTGTLNGQGGDVVDRTALKDYEVRAIELRDARRRAEAKDDREQMGRIDNEMDWLTDQARSGKGKGRRLRQFPAESERARAAVSQTLKAALGQIEQAMPHLSQHLQDSLRFGGTCRYEPRSAYHWVVR